MSSTITYKEQILTEKDLDFCLAVINSYNYTALSLKAYQLQQQYAVIKRASTRKKIYTFYCKLCKKSFSGYLKRLNEKIEEHYIWHIKNNFTTPKPQKQRKSRVIKVKLPF